MSVPQLEPLPPSVEAESDRHPLQSTWTIWYYERIKQDHDFDKALQKLGAFDSIETFWQYYRYLQRPSELPKNSCINIFRGDQKPMWENYEDGGHWLVTISRKEKPDILKLDKLWEQLVFALIGEEFEDPSVVGVALQNKMSSDVLAVWLSQKSSKFRIGEKLKQVLNLQPNSIIEYKNNKSSLKDQSGGRNTESFKIQESRKKDSAATSATATPIVAPAAPPAVPAEVAA